MRPKNTECNTIMSENLWFMHHVVTCWRSFLSLLWLIWQHQCTNDNGRLSFSVDSESTNVCVCLLSAVKPIIAAIEEREYNTSDSITCSADGIPIPSVKWTRISGSMPDAAAQSPGRGQAVLTNLEDGEHMWMCTATNELDSVSFNVSFTGVLCSVFWWPPSRAGHYILQL